MSLKLVEVVVILDIDCSLEDCAQTLSERVSLKSFVRVMSVSVRITNAWVVSTHISVIVLGQLLNSLPRCFA